MIHTYDYLFVTALPVLEVKKELPVFHNINDLVIFVNIINNSISNNLEKQRLHDVEELSLLQLLRLEKITRLYVLQNPSHKLSDYLQKKNIHEFNFRIWHHENFT